MFLRFMRLTASLLAAGLASAFAVCPASAGDRCEGTLCDFYYDRAGAPPPTTSTARPAAPAPLMVPSSGLLGRLFSGGASSQEAQQPVTPGSAPDRKPMVAVQGGGVVGMMRGAAPERCEGTLCDLYYGGPKPETPAATTQDQGAPSVEPAADDALEPPAPRSRAIEEPVEPHCTSDTRDPWRCYRR